MIRFVAGVLSRTQRSAHLPPGVVPLTSRVLQGFPTQNPTDLTFKSPVEILRHSLDVKRSYGKWTRAPVNLYDHGLTGRQKQVAHRVLRALCNLQLSNRADKYLLPGCGLAFMEVRMSGDLRVAHVRWDCADGFKHRLEKHFDKNCGEICFSSTCAFHLPGHHFASRQRVPFTCLGITLLLVN
ncbi:hypothetical protein CYMTET_30108, partial [Cymbomonas tetramitiformis]